MSAQKPTNPTKSTTATTSPTTTPFTTPNAPVHMPFWKTFVAGGTAGIIEILVMYPTDVIKTRNQLSTIKNKNMLSTMIDISRYEGTSALYRGIASPILAEAPKRAVKFATNEEYKKLLSKSDGTLPAERAFIAGALAGSTETVVNCPFEVVKVRMQAKGSTYKSTADCLIQTLKHDGVRGLYAGGEPQLLRNAVWNGTYFGLIGTIRQVIPAPTTATKRDTMIYNFTCGSIAGASGTILNTPLDVVKSRMQNQPRVPQGVIPKYNWTLPSLGIVYREEGISALYRGLGPRLVRLGPGGGIMLVAFDKVSELLKDY